MPMNAPPEYYKAEEKYREARTRREKIEALQEMLRYLPKHKGTENMRKILMRRLAELKEGTKTVGPREEGIRKQGYLVAVLGYPNSGKTTFLNSVCGTNFPVAPYPFTTREPQVCMKKGVQFVEIPGIFPGFASSEMGRRSSSVIRAADKLLILLTPENPKEQKRVILEELEDMGVYTGRRKDVKVKKTGSGGIRVLGSAFLEGDVEELKELLRMMNFHNAEVVINEKCTVEDVLRAADPSTWFVPAVFVMRGEINTFEEVLGALDLIRVYLKPKGGEVSPDPVIVEKGTTVLALFEKVFPRKRLKYARVWGSARFPGQRVENEYMLQDGDVVEFTF